ncbi:MAG: DUF2256 domain-containing protein [Flavobacteriaceae bacterium]|nr:DUF2256 domain-containing protein [Flavobacteriaceae bacterium]
MRGVKKADLPQKICVRCNRPFAWRKKWSKEWENVKYCSKRCKKQKQQD